jgi:hypothetical protein
MNVNSDEWMAAVSDQTDIRSLIIPGTHNSCTFNTDLPVSKCQTYDIYEQFDMGVRYFDIRVDPSDGTPRIVHGLDDLGLTVYDLADMFQDLLASCPSELILLRMQREETDSGIPDSDYFDAMREIRADLFGWQFRKLYTSSQIAAATGADRWTLGANRGALIIVEFNSMSGAGLIDDTNALITGRGGYGFLTAETAQKWDYVDRENTAEFTSGKFNRMNLYSSGGVSLAGIPVPNPKGFTQAFAAQYYTSEYLVKLIRILAQYTNISGGFIVKMDFEELYDGKESFYRTVINMNFNLMRAKMFAWGTGSSLDRLAVNYYGDSGSTTASVESDRLPDSVTMRSKVIRITDGTATVQVTAMQQKNPW